MSRGLFDDLFADRFPLSWQMSVAERFALIAILERLKPPVAIEIGTAHGGSLQVLAANATHVYALDTDPAMPARLAQFTNVDFRVGEAHLTLPPLLAELHVAQTPYPFVLMWGGFALAILEPHPRNRALRIEAHQEAAFQQILARSTHRKKTR